MCNYVYCFVKLLFVEKKKKKKKKKRIISTFRLFGHFAFNSYIVLESICWGHSVS